MQCVSGGYSIPYTEAEHDGITILFTPHGARHSDEQKYQAALARQKGEKPHDFSYGLDIYVPAQIVHRLSLDPKTNAVVMSTKRHGGKVLNIMWGDNGNVHLCSFKRGDWERKLVL